MKIPFNKPHLTGHELTYIQEAATVQGKLSGNGKYTKLCQTFLEEKYGFAKCLLTTSCTDALEMCALLLDIQPGDEVIMPSYTFVSTANAFVLRGATIIFVDSRTDHPGMDEASIEALITPRTKAIVVVHYAGVACDMSMVMDLAEKHRLWVVEDAAQAIDAYYIQSEGDPRPLGSIGHLAAFSFHETKNVSAGEGGMLVVNEPSLQNRAEVIWEKGTDRAAFFRGEKEKYNWVDLGSSFLPSELTAAYLYAQLENIETIQMRRLEIWNRYHQGLASLQTRSTAHLPHIPSHANANGHIFYLVMSSRQKRDRLIRKLSQAEIWAVFHYLPLHHSPYYHDLHDGRPLPHSIRYSECLVRLPMYYDLSEADQQHIIETVLQILG